MNKENVNGVVVLISVIMLLLLTVSGMMNWSLSIKAGDLEDDINDLEEDLYVAEEIKKDILSFIKDLEDDVLTLENIANYWKDKYENEPKVNTVIETEYIIEYINDIDYIYVTDAIFDVNRDMVIDTDDVIEVLWYIKVGPSIIEDIIFEKYGNPYEKLYDVNRDGKVNAEDVNEIIYHCEIFP